MDGLALQAVFGGGSIGFRASTRVPTRAAAFRASAHPACATSALLLGSRRVVFRNVRQQGPNMFGGNLGGAAALLDRR